MLSNQSTGNEFFPLGEEEASYAQREKLFKYRLRKEQLLLNGRWEIPHLKGVLKTENQGAGGERTPLSAKSEKQGALTLGENWRALVLMETRVY